MAYACVAPHGGAVIEQLATRSTVRKFQKTRDGMRKLASEVKKTRPDTIVIATPHNLKLLGKIGIVMAENSSGKLEGPRGSRRSVSLKVKCNVEFAKTLLSKSADRNLPVIGANYGTSEGKTSDMPMDWGTLIPLWFFMKENRIKPQVVIVTPCRETPLAQNFEFGQVIADLAEEQKAKRFVFVASADQAHTHRKSGPYGLNSTAASKYDRIVLDAIQGNKMNSIMSLEPKLVEDAKPDSLWQMTILAGIASRVKMNSQLISYDVPTYYGMTCASFRRANLPV